VRVQHPVRGGSWLKVRAHGTTGFMHASVLSRHAPRRCRHAELDVGQNQRG
jgi:hypothetical protein